MRAIAQVGVVALGCVTGLTGGSLGARAAAPYATPRIGASYGLTVENLPDWNGTWDMTVPQGRPRELAPMFDPEHAYLPPHTAADIGFDVGPPGGTYLTAVPYREQYRKQYARSVTDAREGKSEDPIGACQPYGMPRIMFGTPFGPQIFITPKVVLMILAKGETRLIYTDGRAHPTGVHLLPSWEGHSIGRWRGDTLTVDTVGIFPGNYDQSNAPHSDQIHIEEQIRLVGRNTLEDRMTIEDPMMLTRVWTVTRQYSRSRVATPDVFNFACPPNNGIDMTKGYQEVILPSERDAKGAGR